MEQKSNSKGWAARILGGQPTHIQEVFFWLMVLSLLLWPIGFFVSLFFFDTPINTSVGEICRWGMVLTIWLYPVYLFPLMRFFYWLSKRLRLPLLFCSCPLIPVATLFQFVSIASSEYAAEKPEGYDASTFKRINNTYAKDVNHVYYWNEILEGADPFSFRALSEDYAADTLHVWYNGNIIEGAAPATLVAPGDKNASNLAHDAHDYYWQDQPLHVADMGSFKIIGDGWAVDSRNVYYLGIDAEIGENVIPVGDYRSFRELNEFYAADDKYVYYKNHVVEGADPKTFSVLKGEHNYGKDGNRVYCKARGTSIRDIDALKHKNMRDGLVNAFHTDGTTVFNPELLPMPDGTDFATIRRVERYRDWFADKNRVYYENRLLPGANPQTFKIFLLHEVYKNNDVSNNNMSYYYSYDGKRVYYCDSLMLGVDIPSFISGYDYVESQSFAFDKNRYYQGNPNPGLEKLRQSKYQKDS